MNGERDNIDFADQLSLLGQISPPSFHVLENARDVLWSVVAQEVFSPHDTRTRPQEHEADQPQQTARQRRPQSSPHTHTRRNANPEA